MGAENNRLSVQNKNMDSLEEHLAQLKVLNKKTLSSKPKNSGSCIYDSFNDELTREKNCKKIGPAVPPKPMKDMPQVPQSCIVRKTCEPLYSKRLVVNMGKTQEEINESYAADFDLSSHSNFQTNSNFNSNPNKILFNEDQNTQNSTSNNVSDPRIKKLPILLRKQPPYEQQHHIYANIKMTLDNPAILDQQLEALEHHKKQLEKKGLLASVNKLSTNGPKLSSASYVNGELVAAARSSPSVKMMAAAITENQQKQQSFEKNSKSSMCTNKPLSNLSTNNKSFENTNSLGYQQKQNLDSLPTEQDIVYSNILHSPNLIKYNFLGEKNMYTNIQFNAENLPPPANNNSQTSLLSLRQPETGTCLDYYNTQHQNSIEEDFPLPPSPVSSSYSELRRATDNCPQVSSYPSTVYHNDLDSITQSKQNPFSNASYNDYSTYGEPSTQSFSQSSSASDYYGFGSTCQGSSTYESIYEPITINPTNQLVSRSNFSLYTSYENETHIGNENVSHNAMDNVNITNNPNNLSKDIEVQKFTDLIVNSIDSGNDIDSYGSCVKCGESIVGENSGCTAMDQIYHISCFTCTQCQINLQGKPFYALENKPYCEEDYLNTLEKCSVCMKPILERILRATGKPYHPQCFTCVVCGNSLDGIPFTVDATNQNYCIQDFHKKFAPRCCVCREPIMPDPGQEETVRVVALDRSFHFECYKCEDCGLLLSSEAEGRGCYPLDDHVLCKSCNAKRVQVLTNKMATEL